MSLEAFVRIISCFGKWVSGARVVSHVSEALINEQLWPKGNQEAVCAGFQFGVGRSPACLVCACVA